MWLLVIFIFSYYFFPSLWFEVGSHSVVRGGLVLTMCLRLSSNLCQSPDFSPVSAGVMTMLGLKRRIFVISFCMCVMCTLCACKFRGARAHAYTCRGRRVHVPCSIAFHFIPFRQSHWDGNLSFWLDWPTSELQRYASLHHQCWCYRHMKLCLAFNMSTGFLIQVLIFAHQVLLHT